MPVARRMLPELTSRQCNEYQVQGGDIMLVPVGSVEVLGPHLPIGGRCFAAEALCRLIAEYVDGLYLPVTPYGSVRHTYDRPGSVDVPEAGVVVYVRALMDDLLAAGFRRILVVTYLDYLRYYTPQEFYEDHQVAAAGVHLVEEVYGHGGAPDVGEDSVIVGALRVLGKMDLAERVEQENRRLLASGYQEPALPGALAAVRRVGEVGFTYSAGGYPLPPSAGLSGAAGERALRTTATALAPAVGSLREYNQYLARRQTSRGMLWRGWRTAE